MAAEPVLGIDLGSSFGRVAWWNPESARVEMIPTGGSAGMAAIIATHQGTLVAGDEADRLVRSDPACGLPYRLVKSDLGHAARFGLGAEQVSSSDVATALLRAFKASADAHLGRSFERAVVAYPAPYDVIAQEALRQAATNAGFTEVELVPEIEAAVVAGVLDGVVVGDSILVCDIGTTTTTVSVLARSPDGSFAVITSPRVVPSGCDRIDRALYAHVVAKFRQLGGAGPGLYDEIDESVFERCSELRQELVRADHGVVRDGAGTLVAVDRGWLETAVPDRLDEVRRAAAEAAQEAANAGRPVDGVLLVGGGSTLPAVEKLLPRTLVGPPTLPADPFGSVAIGAAWIGGGARGAEPPIASRPYDTPEFHAFLDDYHREATQRPLVILLAGRTGVGKSSTVNSLLGREVARVNHYEPGTFDVTPYNTDFEGIPFRVVDTPGLCDKPPDHSNNDDLYISKMRTTVGQIDSLWFVTPLSDTRPPGTDELRAIRVLSQAFATGPDIWKCAVIVFTCANSRPPEKFQEALRIKTAQIRRAIADHAGPELAAKVPSVAVENTADLTPDGKPWRGELYTQVCLTIASQGFGGWMFATLNLVDRPGKRAKGDEDADSAANLLRQARRSEQLAERSTAPKIQLNEDQARAVRDRFVTEVVGRYEARGAEIGGSLGGSVGRLLGGSGSSVERAFTEIGSGLGRVGGKVVDWLFG